MSDAPPPAPSPAPPAPPPPPPGGGVLRWPVDPALAGSPAVANRDLFAAKLAGAPVDEAIRRYVYLGVRDMDALLRAGEQGLGFHPVGTGVELGAGCGLLAATAASRPGVERVYAVEVCPAVTERLQPRVAQRVLSPAAAGRVVPTIGSFDDLRLPDASLDFALEIDSLHHSDDLVATLRECARVLKPGAALLCFDRCHPDSVTDAQVEEMLDRVYPRSFLVENGYPTDRPLTRRDNGEHEHRLREWVAAFDAAGFELAHRRVRRPPGARRALKGLLGLAPGGLRRRLVRVDDAGVSTTAHAVARALGSRRARLGRSLVGPKETTAFLATRR